MFTVLSYVSDLERKGEENSNADSAKRKKSTMELNKLLPDGHKDRHCETRNIFNLESTYGYVLGLFLKILIHIFSTDTLIALVSGHKHHQYLLRYWYKFKSFLVPIIHLNLRLMRRSGGISHSPASEECRVIRERQTASLETDKVSTSQ